MEFITRDYFIEKLEQGLDFAIEIRDMRHNSFDIRVLFEDKTLYEPYGRVPDISENIYKKYIMNKYPYSEVAQYYFNWSAYPYPLEKMMHFGIENFKLNLFKSARDRENQLYHYNNFVSKDIALVNNYYDEFYERIGLPPPYFKRPVDFYNF